MYRYIRILLCSSIRTVQCARKKAIQGFKFMCPYFFISKLKLCYTIEITIQGPFFERAPLHAERSSTRNSTLVRTSMNINQIIRSSYMYFIYLSFLLLLGNMREKVFFFQNIFYSNYVNIHEIRLPRVSIDFYVLNYFNFETNAIFVILYPSRI